MYIFFFPEVYLWYCEFICNKTVYKKKKNESQPERVGVLKFIQSDALWYHKNYRIPV